MEKMIGLKMSNKNKSSGCPYHIKKEHGHSYAVVIYGYIEETAENLEKEKNGHVYTTGCVPDSWGINIVDKNGNLMVDEWKWYYPTKRCNKCKKFYDYKTEEDGAFLANIEDYG